MHDVQTIIAAQRIIPQNVMLAVLNRCDDTRDFMVEMWQANPQLARQGGTKVATLLSGSNNITEVLDDAALHA